MCGIPTFEQFINESKKGEYSYKEMRKFLEDIILYMAPVESGSKGPNISIPTGSNSSKRIYKYDQEVLPLFDRFHRSYKNDNPTYYVWNFMFDEQSLSKKVSMQSYQRIDIRSLLNIAKNNKGQLLSFNVGMSSSAGDAFSRAMSGGKFGSLD